MGRTIHYTATKITGFTGKDYNKMLEISNKYNSGKLKNIWSCENFYLDPLAYYPASRYTYNEIDARYDQLFEQKDMHHLQVIRQLKKEKLIEYANENPKYKVSGFTKVQGNELNSMLVYMALTEISIAIPSAKIIISDEGEYLLCDVRLIKGKAYPLLYELTEDITILLRKLAIEQTDVLNELDYIDDMSREFRKDAGLYRWEYGKELLIKWINEKLRNLKEIETRLFEYGLSGYELFFYNIENHRSGFPPELFTRHVDIDMFKDYISSPETLMDGFNGEGFGLASQDHAKSKSLHLAAMWQNITNEINKQTGKNYKLELLNCPDR